MLKKSVRRAGLAAMTAAMVVAISTAQAHAAGGSGTVEGHYLTAAGDPVAGVDVYVYLNGNFGGSGTTDGSGAFHVTVPAGTYVVQFNRPDGIAEFAPNAPAEPAATRYVVAGGGTVTIEEHASPTATIEGTVYRTDGVTPAPYGFLHVRNSQYNLDYTADIGENGRYSLLVGAGIGYQIEMSRGDSLTEWFPRQPTQATAGVYTPAADQDMVLDEIQGATGTLAGTFTDTSGNPLIAEVTAILPDGSVASIGYTLIDGTWSIPVLGGYDYIARFQSYGDNSQTEYAYGSIDAAHATHFSPGVGETITIDEVLGGAATSGNVAVHAADSASGATVLGFCAAIGGRNDCTTNGTVTLTGIPTGGQSVEVFPTNERYLDPAPVTVTVVDGQTVPVTVPLKLGATIKATIVDAVTGAPVAGACVVAFKPGVTVWSGGGPCSGADGIVRINQLATTGYSLFVTPPDGSGYGAQWVGNTRGQGSESGARVVNAVQGKTVTTATIKLDRAGTVTGVVTGVNSHGPLAGTIVGPQTITPGLGDIGHDVVTDANGRYTITDLGPYAWPLFAMHAGYAPQWSGGAGNRYTATPVTVVAGSSVTFDLNLKKGTTLGGTVTIAGTSITDGRVTAYNTVTGDPMGDIFVNPDGTWSMAVIPGQNVKLAYQLSLATGGPSNGWYGGTSQSDATSLKITSPGQTNIAIVG
jgi:hypothetical protein